MDNEILIAIIEAQIHSLGNEIKIANRYWKADLQGQLKAYENVLVLLKGSEII